MEGTAFPMREAEKVINAALDEDVGTGDVTTLATVPAGKTARARLIAKENLRLAGLPAFVRVFEILDPKARLEWEILLGEGTDAAKGDTVLTVTGPAAVLLTGERTALNLLQRLSGIATMTREWAAALAGAGAKLVDTRKTTPGLRALEKYAVRAGGGKNHRVGLFDGVLIKENHIRAAGSITRAVEAARGFSPHTLKIEVEVTTMEELAEAVGCGADIVLLDNMTAEEMASAVKIAAGRVAVEASGNMTLERLPEVAATGVDLISAGAITHSARAVDLSFLLY